MANTMKISAAVPATVAPGAIVRLAATAVALKQQGD